MRHPAFGKSGESKYQCISELLIGGKIELPRQPLDCIDSQTGKGFIHPIERYFSIAVDSPEEEKRKMKFH